MPEETEAEKTTAGKPTFALKIVDAREHGDPPMKWYTVYCGACNSEWPVHSADAWTHCVKCGTYQRMDQMESGSWKPSPCQ